MRSPLSEALSAATYLPHEILVASRNRACVTSITCTPDAIGATLSGDLEQMAAWFGLAPDGDAYVGRWQAWGAPDIGLTLRADS